MPGDDHDDDDDEGDSDDDDEDEGDSDDDDNEEEGQWTSRDLAICCNVFPTVFPAVSQAATVSLLIRVYYSSKLIKLIIDFSILLSTTGFHYLCHGVRCGSASLFDFREGRALTQDRVLITSIMKENAQHAESPW